MTSQTDETQLVRDIALINYRLENKHRTKQERITSAASETAEQLCYDDQAENFGLYYIQAKQFLSDATKSEQP